MLNGIVKILKRALMRYPTKIEPAWKMSLEGPALPKCACPSVKMIFLKLIFRIVDFEV